MEEWIIHNPIDISITLLAISGTCLLLCCLIVNAEYGDAKTFQLNKKVIRMFRDKDHSITIRKVYFGCDDISYDITVEGIKYNVWYWKTTRSASIHTDLRCHVSTGANSKLAKSLLRFHKETEFRRFLDTNLVINSN